MSDRGRRMPPFVTGIIEGDRFRVLGQELSPLVRVTSHVRRRALVGEQREVGQGRGFVHMRPVAIVDRGEGDDIYLTIRDQTKRSITWLLLAALVAPIIALVLIYLSRRIYDSPS